jgi:hypothetical protein
MRVSVHIGPLRATQPDYIARGLSPAALTTHRLLDAPVVRGALAMSESDRTFLVVTLSERVYEYVIATGTTVHAAIISCED